MKDKFMGLKPVVQIVLLDLFGGLVINGILQSHILQNSKISLAVLVGVGTLLAIIGIYHRSFRRHQEETFARMDRSFTDYFTQLKELAEDEDEKMASHCKELEDKIRIFEQRESMFPLVIAREYEIYSIIRKGFKPFTQQRYQFH